jgi:acyl-CoA thioesterase I
MLGTNDARVDYAQSLDNFVGDYLHLLSEIQGLDTKPIVFIVKPRPIFQNDLNIDNETFVEKIIPFIEQIADERGLPIIDVFSALENHPEYFQDGVHPTAEGAQIMANRVYEVIVNYTCTH